MVTNNLQQNWNPEAVETPDAQRRRLIRDFVRRVEKIPTEWDPLRASVHEEPKPLVKTPTEEDILGILSPWRPQSLRYAAAKIWHSRPQDRVVWVRTHYDADENVRRQQDEQFAAWKAGINDEDHFDSNPYDDLEQALPWLVLEDKSLFNVGRDWEAVLDTMPELIGPFLRDISDGRLCRVRRDKLVESTQAEIREQALRLTRSEDRVALVEGTNSLQLYSICTVLIIVDQDAFAREKLKLVFADARGHTIRYGFVDPDDDWWLIRNEIFGGPIDGNPVWNNDRGENGVGSAYRADGVVGRDLYGIQDLL